MSDAASYDRSALYSALDAAEKELARARAARDKASEEAAPYNQTLSRAQSKVYDAVCAHRTAVQALRDSLPQDADR